MAEEVDEEDFPNWRDSGEVGQLKFGEQLSTQERSDIQSVVNSSLQMCFKGNPHR